MNNIHTLATQLKTSKKTIVTAESITAGRFAAMLTSVPGSSAYFYGWYTTYAHDAKVQMLWVQQSDLDIYGAVSEYIAQQMSEWALDHSGCDIAISFTGNAGPDPMEDKQVGLTYIWISERSWWDIQTHVYTYLSPVSWREEIIQDTMEYACGVLLEIV